VQLEVLERRALLCDVTATISDGVLNVTGGPYADSIAVVYDSEHQMIEVHSEGHAVATFSVAGVQSLCIRGLDGDDDISIDPLLDIPTDVDGGTGTNTVVHSHGATDKGVLSARGERLAAESDHAVGHSPTNAIRSAVREKSQRPGSVAPILTLPLTGAAHAGTHSAHPTITQLIDRSLADMSAWSRHSSEDPFTENRFWTSQSHRPVSAAPHAPTVVERSNGEHAVDAHSMTNLSSEARAASTNPEFARRSPYEAECPTSSPVGASAVASSSSPVTVGGAVADTTTGAPKVDCKCLAMQRAAKSQSNAQRPPGYEKTLEAVPVEQSTAAADAQLVAVPSKSPVPTCCQTNDESAIEIIPVDFNSNPSDSMPDDPQSVDSQQSSQPSESSPDVPRADSTRLNLWQRLTVVAGLALSSLALHFGVHRPTGHRHTMQARRGQASP
jgi:hypothetical protein